MVDTRTFDFHSSNLLELLEKKKADVEKKVREFNVKEVALLSELDSIRKSRASLLGVSYEGLPLTFDAYKEHRKSSFEMLQTTLPLLSFKTQVGCLILCFLLLTNAYLIPYFLLLGDCQ